MRSGLKHSGVPVVLKVVERQTAETSEQNKHTEKTEVKIPQLENDSGEAEAAEIGEQPALRNDSLCLPCAD